MPGAWARGVCLPLSGVSPWGFCQSLRTFASSDAVAADARPCSCLRPCGHAFLAQLQVKLTLGDTSLTFIDGVWETGVSAATGVARPRAPAPGEMAKQQAEVSKLQKENETLQSEVNLLKFKVPPAHHPMCAIHAQCVCRTTGCSARTVWRSSAFRHHTHSECPRAGGNEKAPWVLLSHPSTDGAASGHGDAGKFGQ